MEAMEVNNKELIVQSVVADVPIKVPLEQIQEPAQQIKHDETPKNTKRKRGRPRKESRIQINLKKFYERGGPPKRYVHREHRDLAPFDPWTSSRLRQNGRELLMKKITDSVKLTPEEKRELNRKKRKHKGKHAKRDETVAPETSICFVNVKEEHNIDALVKDEEESDLCPRINVQDSFGSVWSVCVKEGREIKTEPDMAFDVVESGSELQLEIKIEPDVVYE